MKKADKKRWSKSECAEILKICKKLRIHDSSTASFYKANVELYKLLRRLREVSRQGKAESLTGPTSRLSLESFIYGRPRTLSTQPPESEFSMSMAHDLGVLRDFPAPLAIIGSR